MQIYPDFNFFGGDVVWRIGCTARLAQLVERKALNLVVVGSSPTVGDFNFGPKDLKMFHAGLEPATFGS